MTVRPCDIMASMCVCVCAVCVCVCVCVSRGDWDVDESVQLVKSGSTTTRRVSLSRIKVGDASLCMYVCMYP